MLQVVTKLLEMDKMVRCNIYKPLLEKISDPDYLDKFNKLSDLDPLVREQDIYDVLLKNKWVTNLNEFEKIMKELNLKEEESDAENYVVSDESENYEGSDIGSEVGAEIPALYENTEDDKPSTSRFEDGLTEDPNNIHVPFWSIDYYPDKSISDVISDFGDIGEYAINIIKTKQDINSKLTTEEKALIYMYSLEQPYCLYKTLNQTMRNGTAAERQAYLNYIFYLEKSLLKLEDYGKKSTNTLANKVYRGISTKLDGYKTGRIVTWNSFSSCTTDPKIAFDFMRDQKGTIFIITSLTAKPISEYSSIPNEAEALYPPNARFKIKRIANDEAKSILQDVIRQDLSDIEVIQLDEISVLGGEERPSPASKKKRNATQVQREEHLPNLFQAR